jgi:hypothetical protein
MGRTIKVLAATTALVAAMVVGGHVVQADAAEQPAAQTYEQAMWYFVPTLGKWSAELERTADAVTVKPELEAQLRDLAWRGEYMLYDLEGTPVPAEMADAHERLLAALRQLNEVAQIAAEDGDGAKLLLDTYEPMFDGARHEIRSWLMARIDIAEPVVVGVFSGS